MTENRGSLSADDTDATSRNLRGDAPEHRTHLPAPDNRRPSSRSAARSKPAQGDSMRIQITEELWKEGSMFVSYAPELDIAACGETAQQAKDNLQEVIQINFEEMKKLGTLEKFLIDAGFDIREHTDDVFRPNKELIGFTPREIPV